MNFPHLETDHYEAIIDPYPPDTRRRQRHTKVTAHAQIKLRCRFRAPVCGALSGYLRT